MGNFVLGILIAAVIGLATFLVGIKSLTIMVPNWRLKDCFDREKVTNSGIVVVALIIALGMIIASAIY